jgi:formamidase
MAHHHIHIDPALPLVRQADKGHNRWHPDIAPAIRIASGSSVEMETLDALDGQIKASTTAADLNVDAGRAHALTGPVYVDGAEPGDLLAVKIEQIVPASRGYTLIGRTLGLLRDLFTAPPVALGDGAALPSRRNYPACAFPVRRSWRDGLAPSQAAAGHRGPRGRSGRARGAVKTPAPRRAVPQRPASPARRSDHRAARGNGNFDIKSARPAPPLSAGAGPRRCFRSATRICPGDSRSAAPQSKQATFVGRFDVLKGRRRDAAR